MTSSGGRCDDVHPRDGEELLINLASKHTCSSSNGVESNHEQDGVPVSSFGSQGPYQDGVQGEWERIFLSASPPHLASTFL